MVNQVFQGGNSVSFGWSSQNSFLISHLNLYLKNATDSLAVLMNAQSQHELILLGDPAIHITAQSQAAYRSGVQPMV
jgi:hypothetical protein